MLLRLTVNGRIRAIEIDANTSPPWVLRKQLDMTGTKYGCGIAGKRHFSSRALGHPRRGRSLRGSR
jgi:aerobic-type carbon monoxide dehydrogenase small subunit (CoxS/CutS family)